MKNSKIDEGNYAANLLKILATCFIALLAFLVYKSMQLSKQFPILTNADSLNDTISNIIDDGRGAARVTFQSNKKFSLPWATNENYTGDNSELTRMVGEGDIIIKKQLSDTLLVKHLGQEYIFVAKKTIRSVTNKE